MDAPGSVVAIMEQVGVWWGVAGGWAIDLWLGEQTRDHHDVEVVVRRRDQRLVHAALADGHELFALDPPGTPWGHWSGVPIEAPAFQLQVRCSAAEFDIFTEDVDDVRWQFRRDRRVTRAASDILVHSAAGIPVVRPEIQLLYMATSGDPKNELDFGVARPRLTTEAAQWLHDALEITLPGHRWAHQLR